MFSLQIWVYPAIIWKYQHLATEIKQFHCTTSWKIWLSVWIASLDLHLIPLWIFLSIYSNTKYGLFVSRFPIGRDYTIINKQWNNFILLHTIQTIYLPKIKTKEKLATNTDILELYILYSIIRVNCKDEQKAEIKQCRSKRYKMKKQTVTIRSESEGSIQGALGFQDVKCEPMIVLSYPPSCDDVTYIEHPLILSSSSLSFLASHS